MIVIHCPNRCRIEIWHGRAGPRLKEIVNESFRHGVLVSKNFGPQCSRCFFLVQNTIENASELNFHLFGIAQHQKSSKTVIYEIIYDEDIERKSSRRSVPFKECRSPGRYVQDFHVQFTTEMTSMRLTRVPFTCSKLRE